MVELSDWVGFLGVFLCLYAFYIVQAGKINHAKYTYSLFNLIGFILIMFSLVFNLNMPSLVIEIAWFMISVYGIHKVHQRRKKRNFN